VARLRLIFIVESPFTHRDEMRFRLKVLEERGISTEVWDISELLLPRSQLQWQQPPRATRSITIASFHQLHTMVSSLKKQDCLLLHAGLDKEFWKRMPVEAQAYWAAISSAECRLGALHVGSIPTLRPWSARRLALFEVSRQLRPILSNLADRSYRRSDGQGLFAPDADQGPPQLDFIWADTNVDAFDPRLISDTTKITYIHSLDYDQVLDVKGLISSEPFVSFIDCMGPSHPDYRTHAMKFDLQMTSYSDKVCRALDALENRFGLETVVAAHPRARPCSLDEWYGGRQVTYQDTARLVARSSLVVTADPSTAVGMAVATQKPILFFTSREFQKENRLLLKEFSGQLRAPLISIDSRPRIPLPMVDSDAYSKYMESYVRRQSTPDKPFWSVAADQALSGIVPGDPE